MGAPAASSRLQWIWVPLPVPSGCSIGARIARWPNPAATARASSRTSTAWSAARRPVWLRAGGHLELARGVLGKEGVGFDPGPSASPPASVPPNGPCRRSALQRVGRRRALRRAGIDQLLLEGGEQVQAELRPERRKRTREEAARTTLPGCCLRAEEVAEQQVDVGRAGHRDARLRRRVRHQHQVASRAERRVVDWSERRQHQVAVGDADAPAHATRQFSQRDRLAAQQPGQVAGADEGQRLRRHTAIPYSRAAVSWNRARCSAGVYSATTSRKRSHSAA